MGKSVDDIMRDYAKQRSDNVGRNRDYAYLHAIYHGLYFDNRNRDIMDGQGRVTLRDNRREDRANPLVANLLKAIVDDYVATAGVLPDIKVPPPSQDQPGQDFADMVEKYHYGVWHASSMVMQLKSMAWWNSVMGGCAALVWPNFQKKHAEIRFVGPDKVYGVPDLLNPFAFSSAIISEFFTQRTIKDYFPNRTVQELFRGSEDTANQISRISQLTGGQVEIIRFFDKNEVVTILGREQTNIKGRPTGQKEAIAELGRVSHGLGHCLVMPFQNIFVPGETRGMSDVEQSVGMNQYINFLLNADEEYIKQELFAPLILIDPQKAPEDIDLEDPTAVIPINAGGDAKRLTGSTGGQQVMTAEMNRMQQLIEFVSGTVTARTEGRVRSSITTGRGMEKSQGPFQGRMEYRNDLNGYRLEKVNELSVILTEAEFGDEDVQLFGTRARGGGMFRVVMKGKDLSGYTFNKVLYSPSMHMGLDQRIVAVLQLRGAQPRPLIDSRTAIEILGITDHPDEMLQAIEEEMQHDIQFQQQLKKATESADPQAQQVSGESGATPKGPNALNPSPGGAGAPPAATPPPSTNGAGAGSPATPAGPTPLGSMAAPASTQSLAGAENLMAKPAPPPPGSGLEGSDAIEKQISQLIMGLKLNGNVYLVSADKDEIRILTDNYIDARRVGRVLRQHFGEHVSVRESSKIPKDATLLNDTGGGPSAG